MHNNNQIMPMRSQITRPITTRLAGQVRSHVVLLGLHDAGDSDTLRPVPQAVRSIGAN